MLDFLLGLLLAALLVRGWRRALRAEAVDLVALVAAIAIAFRLSEPLGEAIADRFGATPETARMVVGIIVFLIVVAGTISIGHTVRARMEQRKPGFAQRLGGAAVAMLNGLVMVALLATIIRVLPFGDSADRALDDSTVTALVIPRGGVAEAVVGVVAGDDVMRYVLALEPVVGDRRVVVVDEESVEIEAVEAGDLDIRDDLARVVEEWVNETRLANDLTPVPWSEGLAGVATSHAVEMYEMGYLSHRSPVTGTPADRVEAESITLVEVNEVIGLAATVSAVHDAVVGVPVLRDGAVLGDYDRLGVGVVEGAYGMLVVEVFGR